MEDSIGKPNNGNKKVALEELDRDELLKRCKSYLALAQRAKQAKDEAQQRESYLLDKISNLEGQASQLVTQEKHSASRDQHDHTDCQGFSLTLQISDLESQLKLRNEEKTLLLSQSEDMEAKLKTLEESYEQQKNGFVEELNKMNDVLKQRGETITRLEEKCQINEKEFKVKTETFLQLVAEKERKIELLESEANKFETQSEILSTSTVSKAEEIHRMKDVEDSLEDRYNKLKMLAVRMKRKIAEQNNQLHDKENQLALLRVDEKNRNISNSPLNLQAAQKEIDRLNDELDAKKSELNVMKKDCENSIQELANKKSIQEHKLLYDDCRKENESEKILRVELSKECDRFKSEIKQLSCTVDELNKKNQAVKQESKKQSLLELELTDYEKSVSDLNAQLDAMKKELLLEQQVATEQQRGAELKMTLDAIQLQLDSCQSELLQQRTEIRHVIARAESKENEVDNLKLQLSTVTTELHKVQTGSAILIETLRKQLVALEESAATEKVTRDNLHLELSELRAEYDNYKIRATSVLKKQKTEANPASLSSKEAVNVLNTDQVEREMLQRVVEALKTKIAEIDIEFAIGKGTKCSNPNISIETMRQRLERAESEIEIIKREHQEQVSRLQSDNQLLASLHREQMDGLKLRHNQEILKLQNNLDEIAFESARLQKVVTNYQAQRTVSPIIKGDQRRDDYAMVERERGEGSEDGNVTHRQREDTENDSRKPIPLELLLSSQLASEDTVVFPNESVMISYEQHRESLAIVEKRCKHLAALLAESEANEARFSQLADALKEEIRRAERSEERQKHIENLEYLKNVVLKFVTLPRGEERSRLVPVLTTLLRLSPLEVQEVHQTFSRQSADGMVRPIGWGGVFNYFAPNQ
ncbi:putative GRIP and coiled-coil domain-containing protein 2 [Daphnia magna]|uniref:Putative GRIP and coiled-coil domain-containing protein 2 n=1 Tax=Daphnia magna TaxID=35525 RepID=A0A164YFR1_9CRUS|nr:putative GRIP and coiled-coil domain-containing protein 2 [Daphnia magna]